MSIYQIEKCSKKQDYISVPNFSAALPVTVIRGAEDGPKVLITAGIHNEEYTGIETANRLAYTLQPSEIRGCIAIIHICNTTGFVSHARDIVPEDENNLNRCFPGSADSGPAHRLAHFITQEFLLSASIHIDLHCGGGREELLPHVYYQAMAGQPLMSASMNLAELMDVEYMVASKTYSGSAFSHAAFYGIPSILMERGGMAKWTEAEVQAYLADVYRVLHRIGVLAECEEKNTIPKVIDKMEFYSAEADGCWYPSNAVGSTVHKGELLGAIKDTFGNVRYTVTALNDSVVLYQLGSYSVHQGELTVSCGNI